jgi:hypothetical protein
MMGFFPITMDLLDKWWILSKIPGLMGAASHHLEELRKYGIDELGGAGSLRYKLRHGDQTRFPFFQVPGRTPEGPDRSSGDREKAFRILR